MMTQYTLRLDPITAKRLEWHARHQKMKPEKFVGFLVRRALGIQGDFEIEEEMKNEECVK